LQTRSTAFMFHLQPLSTASSWVFRVWLLVRGWVCCFWWLWLPSDSLSFCGKGTSFIFSSSFLFNSSPLLDTHIAFLVCLF
jgi:hypothetical protein